MQNIPNVAVTPEQVFASGDTVAVVVRYTGGKDTAKELGLPVVHVWEVRDGNLAQFRQFVNTAKFREVLAARLRRGLPRRAPHAGRPSQFWLYAGTKQLPGLDSNQQPSG